MTSPQRLARRRPSSRPVCAATLLTLAALGLSACGGAEPGTTAPSNAVATEAASSSSATESTPSATSAASSGTQAAALTVTDPWTKATDGPMTGSFATLVNSSDAELHVVAVHSEIGGSVELHHMVDDGTGQSVMQPAPDGFTVPAHGTYTLAPGGSHVMLMDLAEPVEPGDVVAFTLELADGSRVDVESVARPFTGANESYHGEGGAPSGSDSPSGSSAPASHGHADH